MAQEPKTLSVIIPHLICAHLLADYILQTGWLAERKGQFTAREMHSWDGLLLHGVMVWLVTLAVLPSYLEDLWPYITALAVIHTLQDGIKIWFSSRLRIHAIIPYAIDQLLHAAVIMAFYLVTRGFISPEPAAAETTFMLFGASLVAVTRFYEVTWWSNWFDMFAYLKRWRFWGYLERITMLLLSIFNLWFIAPLVVLPRVYTAYRRGDAVWNQKRGVLELLLGIIFSVILGFAF